MPETSLGVATGTNPETRFPHFIDILLTDLKNILSQYFFLFQDRENRAEYMTTLLQQINFARMRIDERRKAEIDLVEMGINGYKALSNTLYASQILHEKDIEMIKVNCFRDFYREYRLHKQKIQDYSEGWGCRMGRIHHC